MKTHLLIATALVAGLAWSVTAKAAPKSVILPELSLNQPDLPLLDQVAANKAPHYKIKGVNVDDDADGEDSGDDSGQVQNSGHEGGEGADDQG